MNKSEIRLQNKREMRKYGISELPKGCSLVVFDRSFLGNVMPLERKFVAVPKGGEVGGKCQLGWRSLPFKVRKEIEYYSFTDYMDCNEKCSFTLPNGSFILEGEILKVWTPCRSVEYNY